MTPAHVLIVLQGAISGTAFAQSLVAHVRVPRIDAFLDRVDALPAELKQAQARTPLSLAPSTYANPCLSMEHCAGRDNFPDAHIETWHHAHLCELSSALTLLCTAVKDINTIGWSVIAHLAASSLPLQKRNVGVLHFPIATASRGLSVAAFSGGGARSARRTSPSSRSCARWCTSWRWRWTFSIPSPATWGAPTSSAPSPSSRGVPCRSTW